jgi:heme-degrading monooxygenase HmoA
VITRVWRGWTTTANSGAYHEHFETAVLPHLDQVEGFRGAQLWRREAGEQVEFVAVTFFDSIEAVRRFTGLDHERAVVEPDARRVLERFDERCLHYVVVTGQ